MFKNNCIFLIHSSTILIYLTIIEYCEFSGMSEKCKQWLITNLPEVATEQLKIDEGEGGEQQAEKKHQVEILLK